MTVLTEPSSFDVQAVVDEVWTTFLGGEPLVPVAPDFDPAGTFPGSRWDAAVTVSGAWHGLIVVSVNDAVAHAVTQAMLGLDDGDTAAHEDVVDALGELVNVIGGNIKSLMDGPSKLSLPLVAQAPIQAGGIVETCRLDLAWGSHRVWVTVGTRDEGGTS
ncbi:chemotaxis protein CheX [Nocardioides rubriscoriae]|uniref:chemotaxis protein CheX n=1 Tax=Nocardioides rubriscoriae TaxID=642762 RepID=UPI0011E03427|nr:chemotaxis protein CheX [Nocardioides rubriscoriae]